MLTAIPEYLTDIDEALELRQDIFSRMSDVELLAELRCIASLAARRSDVQTAGQAGDLFSVFYAYRTELRVPASLWEATRAFVRQHAQ